MLRLEAMAFSFFSFFFFALLWFAGHWQVVTHDSTRVSSLTLFQKERGSLWFCVCG